MKPAWDKLMTEFADHKTILVADVDCTASGQSLCQQVGVRGYPTIKHGDPNTLEDYKGGRDFAALKKFADGLKPSCSPANLDLCDATQAAEINKIMALPPAELESQIQEKEKAIADLEKDFEKKV